MNKLELPLANKSLGQHFLKDQNVISRICSDFKGQAEAIVEIGPGPGILTESLAIRAKEENIPFFIFHDHCCSRRVESGQLLYPLF